MRQHVCVLSSHPIPLASSEHVFTPPPPPPGPPGWNAGFFYTIITLITITTIIVYYYDTGLCTLISHNDHAHLTCVGCLLRGAVSAGARRLLRSASWTDCKLTWSMKCANAPRSIDR